MPFEVMQEGGTPVKMWLPEGHEIEDQARRQLQRASRLPFVTDMACMPDVHVGIGATIGSVIGTDRAIIPAAVGVDIGCGMMAQRLNVDASQLPDSWKEIRSAIEAAVPHGRTNHGQDGDRGAWGESPIAPSNRWRDDLSGKYETIIKKDRKKISHKSPLNQLGTLGGGNHFIVV